MHGKIKGLGIRRTHHSILIKKHNLQMSVYGRKVGPTMLNGLISKTRAMHIASGLNSHKHFNVFSYINQKQHSSIHGHTHNDEQLNVAKTTLN